MYTLDTNAVIYYLKGESEVVRFLESVAIQQVPIYVASITELELFSFPKLTNREIQQIEDFLGTLSAIGLDSQIARLAGSLRRHHGLKVPDSIVGATTLFTGSILVTRNIRDFRKIPGMSLHRV